MDSTLIPVTITFIIFIILAYYLNVIKISIPLVMIYFIYCFSYFISDEKNNYNQDISNKSPSEKEVYKDESEKINDIAFDSTVLSIQDRDIFNDPKPIVSSSPKPIVIDSNLVSKKNRDTNYISPKKITKKDISKVINDEKLKPTLRLNEIMICRGIYKRNPIKPGIKFINNVDSLFCYTKISNSGNKQEIKHIWYFENKEVTTVSYNIKTSYNYRSWSKKTVYPNQTGNWRVDVVDSNGEILGTRDFTINSINATY